ELDLLIAEVVVEHRRIERASDRTVKTELLADLVRIDLLGLNIVERKRNGRIDRTLAIATRVFGVQQQVVHGGVVEVDHPRRCSRILHVVDLAVRQLRTRIRQALGTDGSLGSTRREDARERGRQIVIGLLDRIGLLVVVGPADATGHFELIIELVGALRIEREIAVAGGAYGEVVDREGNEPARDGYALQSQQI